jgi:hypothetical protein
MIMMMMINHVSEKKISSALAFFHCFSTIKVHCLSLQVLPTLPAESESAKQCLERVRGC